MRSAPELGALLDELRGVTWPARRTVPATMTGLHPSRLRGSSPEFTEFRPYRQGDDPRRIDWKLLARSDRTYIRLTDDRATLPTLIAVDGSASMAFPEQGVSKWKMAMQLAVGLAALAHAAADPVGLVVATGEGVRRMEPRSRRGILAEIIASLTEAEPRGRTDLALALSGVRAPRLLIIGDFLDGEEALLRAARTHRAAGGEVHAVHVVAAEELDPPTRAVMAVDPEDPGISRTLARGTRAEYLERFAAWRDELARGWRASGAGYDMVRTDDPAARAVRGIAGVYRSPAAAQ